MDTQVTSRFVPPPCAAIGLKKQGDGYRQSCCQIRSGWGSGWGWLKIWRIGFLPDFLKTTWWLPILCVLRDRWLVSAALLQFQTTIFRDLHGFPCTKNAILWKHRWNMRFLRDSFTRCQERHVQIVRKGSDTLRRNARVIVVSYDLVAQNDTWISFGSTEDLSLACRRWMLFMLFHDVLLVWYFSVVTQETFRRTPAGRPYRMVICDEALLCCMYANKRSTLCNLAGGSKGARELGWFKIAL